MANYKNITFDQLHAALVVVKDEIDKKANIDHGQHVTFNTTVTELIPGDDGRYGTDDANCARADHTHALPAYPTELPNPSPLTIILGEQEEEIVYDGSTNRNIEISRYVLDAAPTMHASTSSIYGLSSSTEYGHVKATSTTPLVAGSAYVGMETDSFARGDHVHPEQVNISGNAETATKLRKQINIVIGSTSKRFDGSTDVVWTIDEVGAAPIELVDRATEADIENMILSVLGVDLPTDLTEAVAILKAMGR